MTSNFKPKPEEQKEKFLDVLRNVDYAVFDFDGTVYPRLFVFDVTKKIFSDRRGEEAMQKLQSLVEIATIYKGGDFVRAYGRFVELLEGESRDEFERNARSLMKNSYEYAKRTIEKLRTDYKIDSYMISMTADFIADAAREYLGFRKVFSVPYLYEGRGPNARFNGRTGIMVEDPQIMKAHMIAELRALKKNSRYVSFFDSSDDLPVAESAMLRVAINPKPDLSRHIRLDFVGHGEIDPWKGIYELID